MVLDRAIEKEKDANHSPLFSPPTVARALRHLATSLRAGKSGALTEAGAIEGYGAVVAAVDAVAFEGVLEAGAGEARAARLRGE